jgi:hypothetical protein
MNVPSSGAKASDSQPEGSVIQRTTGGSHMRVMLGSLQFRQAQEISHRPGGFEPAAEDGSGDFRDEDIALSSDGDSVRSD